MDKSEKIIRKNKAWTHLKMVIVFIMLLILYLFLDFLDVKLFAYAPVAEGITLDILLILFIGFTLFCLLAIYLNYKCEYLILRADEIIKRTGILMPRYDSFTYSQFETIRYQQNAIGKKLNFGNIMIKISTQDSDLELRDIEDPEKNMLIIKDFIKKGKL